LAQLVPHHQLRILLQVYEKKVSSLTNFNLEGRVAGMPASKMNPPKLSQPLRLPKVRSLALQLMRIYPACIRTYVCLICR
jgi:hypothetical protein